MRIHGSFFDGNLTEMYKAALHSNKKKDLKRLKSVCGRGKKKRMKERYTTRIPGISKDSTECSHGG